MFVWQFPSHGRIGAQACFVWSPKIEPPPVGRSCLGADFSLSSGWLGNEESVNQGMNGSVLQNRLHFYWAPTVFQVLCWDSQPLSLWNLIPPLWVQDAIPLHRWVIQCSQGLNDFPTAGKQQVWELSPTPDLKQAVCLSAWCFPDGGVGGLSLELYKQRQNDQMPGKL